MNKVKHKNNTVAVLVPTHKKDLSPDEQISLRHLRRFLNAYDKYFVVPDGLDLQMPHDDFKVKRFDRKYFRSVKDYNKLLISKLFYKTFIEYEYLLIYELDSLVFSDQLLYWCNKGYDYIGAPWHDTEYTKKIWGWSPGRDCVGNSGFSLRKTKSCLKTLNAYYSPMRIIMGIISARFSMRNLFADSQLCNDHFWAFRANKYYPDFKIPTAEIAVSFSFETEPGLCFEKNNQTLPFGCHAWARYDRSFWEPYLLK